MGGFAPMSPRISSPARGDNNSQGGNRSRGGFKGGRQGRGQRDVGLIGKTVVVKQGPYKGHYGVVKDATETTHTLVWKRHTEVHTIHHHWITQTKLRAATDLPTQWTRSTETTTIGTLLIFM